MNIIKNVYSSEWFSLFCVVLLSIFVVSAFHPSFLSQFNIYILLMTLSVSVLIAFSQMIILSIGQMNLAVGTLGGLSAIVFSASLEVFNLPIPIAIICGLLTGALGGVLTGVITALTGISAFIVTLSAMSIFKGINLGVTEAQPFTKIPELVKWFGSESLFSTIPLTAILTLVITIIMWFFLNRHVTGREMLAYGTSITSAKLSGISERKTVITAHVISGLLAATAGMLMVARLQQGLPSIGDDWLIQSFAAPVIGGAVLAGGRVNIIGTLLGVVLVVIISQSLVLFNVDPYFVQLLLGLMILAAVSLNRYREIKRQKLKQGAAHV